MKTTGKTKVNSRQIHTFGGQQTTYPIKETNLIEEIIRLQKVKFEKAKTRVKKEQAYRNYMIFFIGVNTALRADDLLQLRVCDIDGYVHIREAKTGKVQNYKLAKEITTEVKKYVEYMNLTKYDYMFRGQKKREDGKPYIYPINRQQGHRIISEMGKEVGLNSHFGLHSLRKTFGYQFVKNGGDVNTLQRMYNHSDLKVTQIYISWDTRDVEDARENFYISPSGKVKYNKKK